MADITNPQAVAFSDNSVRPICEKVRALKAQIDDAMIAWFGGVDSAVGNSANDMLQDGREAEGVSRLNGEDITGVMTVLGSIQSTLNGAGVPARIQKPCVRPLEAN